MSGLPDISFLNGYLAWLFGPGWFVWVVVLGVVLAYGASKKFRARKVIVQESQPAVPTAEEYIGAAKKDGAVPDMPTHETEPKPDSESIAEPEHDADFRPDARLLMLKEALDEADRNMLNSIVKAIREQKFEVNLKQVSIAPQLQPVKREAEAPVPPPPTE